VLSELILIGGVAKDALSSQVRSNPHTLDKATRKRAFRFLCKQVQGQ
jgi:hypothetical protein